MVADHRPQAELISHVPRTVVDWLRTEPDRRAQPVDGSLVSADLSGFTRLSERLAALGRSGAEELNELLNDCFDRMINGCESHGGDVLKFGGDALLVLFTGASHPERACLASAVMRESIRRPLVTHSGSRVRLSMSVGVHSGDIWLYLVDCDGHNDLVVAGPGSTSAVRCEAAAQAGQILVSEETAAAVPAAWRGSARPEGRLLRGLPVVLGDQNDRAVSQPGPLPDLAPLIPAAQIEVIRAGLSGEHRQVTVAFLGLVGLDVVAAQGGMDQVGRVLSQVALEVGRAANRHGVYWLASDVYPDSAKFLLTAGAPRSSGADENDMLRALREIMDVEGARLRVGVNRGHVYAGALGGPTRQTFTVMGDAVNLAARLMQRASPGEIVASSQVLDYATARFDLTPLEPFPVKGKQALINASLVGRHLGDPLPQDAARPPYIRPADFDRLLAEASVTADGPGVVIDLVGEPGMGKSRLADELIAELSSRPVFPVWGQAYQASTPYWSAQTLLRQVADIDGETPPPAAGDQLSSWVEGRAPELLPWLPLLATAFGAEVPSTPEVDRIAARFRQARLHAVLTELLERTLNVPCVVRLEDVQWMDAASRSAFDALLSRLDHLPWTVITTRHPNGPPLGGDDNDHRHTTEVSPLDASDTLRLAASVGDGLPPDWLGPIADRAAGHPVFVIELMAAAATHGIDALPDSVESAITSRLDALPASERALVREASVVGIEIDLEVLEAALGEEAGRRDRWAALEGVVALDADGKIRFRHPLIQRVAYEGCSYRRRRQVHRLVAQVVGEGVGPSRRRQQSLCSLHFHLAEDWPNSWQASVRAGREAQSINAIGEAIVCYERAIASAPHIDGLETGEWEQAAETLADLYELDARYVDAQRNYRLANRLAGSSRPLAARLLRKQGVLRERAGRYRDALSWYGRGLHLMGVEGAQGAPARPGSPDVAAETEGDTGAALAETHQLLLAYAGVRFRQGRFRECGRLAGRVAESSSTVEARAHALLLLLGAGTCLGDRDSSVSGERALALYEELGDHLGRANVLNNLGIAAYYAGRWNDAVAKYEQSRAERRRAGDTLGEAVQAMNLAEVFSDQGRFQEAVALLDEAGQVFETARYPVGVGIVQSDLGRVMGRSGQPEEGLRRLDAAVATLGAIGSNTHMLDANLRRAECLLWLGAYDEADAIIRDLAGPIQRREGEPDLAVAVSRCRAWLLLHERRSAEAVAVIESAIAEAERLDLVFERGLLLQVLHAADPGAADADPWQTDPALRALGIVSPPPMPPWR
jgi:class 3 adenylate cyclase/tetratricopeptide (TPR) repeat protein